MRDHDPVEISQFNGLWMKGDEDNTPIDHFSDGENFRFVGKASFGSRFGIDVHQSVVAPLGNVVRIYNYITQDKNTLLVLTYDAINGGRLYHVVDGTTMFGPILSIMEMEDFGFYPWAGRAYITPFRTYQQGGNNPPIEKGLQNEFLYVYLGAGAAARKAAGDAPTGNLTVANGAAGNTDPGFHLFGVVFESDTGWLSQPAAFTGFTTVAGNSVSFTTVPISAQAHITKRHIVATKVITGYNGNTTGYQYYFIPNATIPNNVGASISNISFFDADLLEDASHLLDNYSEIPAGVGLTMYRGRLILWTTFTDISLALVSVTGEPEAFNRISGFLIVPLDGNPLTNGQELRDVLYLTKRNRTVSYVDNDDEPSTWPMTVVDQAIGSPVHGIATVIDSGGTSVDFLIMTSLSGVVVFNGRFANPELSWKIDDFWINQEKNDFRYIQIVNDPITKHIYCCLPDRRLLVGNYANGMDPKNIRWTIWRFDVKVNTIALVNINELIIGAEGRLVA